MGVSYAQPHSPALRCLKNKAYHHLTKSGGAHGKKSLKCALTNGLRLKRRVSFDTSSQWKFDPYQLIKYQTTILDFNFQPTHI